MAKQIFIDRYFHGDPSPGNLLVKDSNTIAYLDFGAVGILTKRRKDVLVQMIMAFITGDVDELARAFITLCDKEGEVDESQFAKDVEKVIDYFERERPSVGDPNMLNMIIEASNKHRMLLPADFLMLMKSWYQFEGLCKRLDPDYDVAVVIEPYLRETVLSMFAKEKQEELSKNMMMELMRFLEKLPERVNAILRKIENNDLQLKVSVVGLKEYKEHRERQTVLLGFTVLMAAIMLGFAMVLLAKDGDLTATYAAFSFLMVLLWILSGILWLRRN
jgi:ubiquinone biosynthesis protein